MYNHRLVFTAACLGMLIFGVVITTLGAILPSVIDRFGIDKAEAGSLFLLLSFGILIGSMIFGPIVDRYGYKALLIACSLLVLLGLQAIAFAVSLGWLQLGVLLIGLGGGVINGGTNAVVADISDQARSAKLSLLGIFFGIGAVSVPFSLGILLDSFSYSTLIAAIGFTVLVPVVFMAAIRFPVPKQPQGFPIRQGVGLLRDPVLLLFGLMLFLQSGMEITVGGWTATYFQEELGLVGNRALFFLSLFWFGLMLARLVLGFVLTRMSPAVVLCLCIALAFAGAVLMLTSRALIPAGIGIFLIGAGFAATFPVVLGYVGDRYAALSGTAFSIALAMALTGGMTLPYLAGVIGQAYGLRVSFLIVPVCLLVLPAVLLIVLRRQATVPPASHPTAQTTGDRHAGQAVAR
jgi:MFS transporter, FHS family, glucose/mannose:H+ symporter